MVSYTWIGIFINQNIFLPFLFMIVKSIILYFFCIFFISFCRNFKTAFLLRAYNRKNINKDLIKINEKKKKWE